MPEKNERGYALFQTAIGLCGVCWSRDGITGVQLPEADKSVTERRLEKRAGGGSAAEPPPRVKTAIRRITRLLDGKPDDLADLPLDMSAIPAFHRRIYEAARKIGPGRTAAYGEIARMAGSAGVSRAAGQALARNPFALVVPCHRVLAAGGKPGGFSAYGGFETKRRLLEIEGVELGERGLFSGEGSLPFDSKKAIRFLCRRDAELGRLIRRTGPFRLKLEAASDVFEALAEAIVYQQLTAKAAQTILGRFTALFPGRSFPSPRKVLETGDDLLRRAGLSAGKAKSIKDLAEKTLSGVVPAVKDIGRLEDEEIIERLDSIRGVGRWTVEMLLIFKLGRPDVLPVQDLGIRKGFAAAFGLPSLPDPPEVAARGELWRPYRTVASWYLWRAAEAAGK